jgi:hypothetical protein
MVNKYERHDLACNVAIHYGEENIHLRKKIMRARIFNIHYLGRHKR